MKKIIARFCLALFIATFCIQTMAKAHSSDLAPGVTHLHVTVGADHRHGNQDTLDTTASSEVFISCNDAVVHPTVYSASYVHVIYVDTLIQTTLPIVSHLEQTVIRNNSPPRVATLILPYFSLAPPFVS